VSADCAAAYRGVIVAAVRSATTAVDTCRLQIAQPIPAGLRDYLDLGAQFASLRDSLAQQIGVHAIFHRRPCNRHTGFVAHLNQRGLQSRVVHLTTVGPASENQSVDSQRINATALSVFSQFSFQGVHLVVRGRPCCMVLANRSRGPSAYAYAAHALFDEVVDCAWADAGMRGCEAIGQL
jgi:hypothetical protein